jgi:hypothetical protein
MGCMFYSVCVVLKHIYNKNLQIYLFGTIRKLILFPMEIYFR